MTVFGHPEFRDHEQVVFCRNDAAGLRAIIALHSTRLGPALGGCRMCAYKNDEEALTDVLRLSRAMTYKAACAGLNLGGGQAVIIGDPRAHKSEALFRAFGQFVDSLGGRYITAEDVGTTVGNMDLIHEETSHVAGTSAYQGGAGDPVPLTAWGVFHGIKAAVRQVFGDDRLRGRRIAIQGVGAVGSHLARTLYEEGVKLTVADLDARRLERARREFGATAVAVEDLWSLDVDVIAPCALGPCLDPEVIASLRAPIIAGGANNQLADEARDGALLKERGILYAPDYVINAGGLIHVYTDLHRQPREKAMRDTEQIGRTLSDIFRFATEKDVTTVEASNHVAERRMNRIGSLRLFHRGGLVQH